MLNIANQKPKVFTKSFTISNYTQNKTTIIKERKLTEIASSSSTQDNTNIRRRYVVTE